VLLDKGHQLGSYRVLNLSTVGALLVGRPPLVETQPLEVLVRLSTGRTVRANAAIVREDSVDSAAVFAISFTAVAPPDHEVISHVVLTALEDARDATALIVAAAPEAWHLLKRELDGLGHASFVVSTREDAVTFLEAPNVLTVALVDVALNEDAFAVMTLLADKHPKIRRVLMSTATKTGKTVKSRLMALHDLAQGVLPTRWTHETLAQALTPASTSTQS
jgi:hypothetical protein